VIIKYSGQALIEAKSDVVAPRLAENLRKTLLAKLQRQDWHVADLHEREGGCDFTVSDGQLMIRLRFDLGDAGKATSVDVEGRLSIDSAQSIILLPVAQHFIDSGVADQLLERWADDFSSELSGRSL
jgi:uncharacterized lipoprotein YmbA